MLANKKLEHRRRTSVKAEDLQHRSLRAGGTDSGSATQSRHTSPPASILGRRRLVNNDAPILTGSPSLGGRRLLQGGGINAAGEKDEVKKHHEMRRAMIRGQNPQQNEGLSGTPTVQGRELKDGGRNENVIDCTLDFAKIRSTLPKSNNTPLDHEEERDDAHISTMLRDGDMRFRKGVTTRSESKMGDAFRRSFQKMSGALRARMKASWISIELPVTSFPG
uniref:Uncharacterized protein n=1 Tax=Lotharella globosa TaxID=91324 RepID=A0A7S4DG76_9EUKA